MDFFVLLGETISSAFGRRSFQIIQIISLVLIVGQSLSHEVENLHREGLTLLTGYILLHKIDQRLIHTIDANGREVILPELAESFLYI